MYKKFLIVASKKDKAGVNITTRLSQFGDFKFYLTDKEIIYTENLDLDKINQHDFIIFASKHESKNKEKTLAVHSPGNWRDNNLGGEPGKLCPTSAVFQKQMFEKLTKNAREYELNGYNVTMEATHHGPLIEKPCVFIEIGSTSIEWNDRRAGFVVAKTISEMINEFEENPYNEVAIAIGGPHYCPNFNKIQRNSNIAVSYVLPKYAFPISEEIIQEAIDKTEEEVDFFLVDWKGLGDSEQKQQVLETLNKFYIQYRKTGEINK